ncbi:MAG: thioredoxin-dependent thiol peroxidase [Rhizobium sp.]|nr:thioredoxin-dependent thiol peroxidase [Rhizobium sp.]
MTQLSIGDPAPGFTLPVNGGGTLSLSDHRGEKVVLYFYPQDNTPTCTLQAIEFSSKLAAFKNAGATVIGISPDRPKSHERFCAKHALAIPLVADEDKAAANAYGVWRMKSTFGRKYEGIVRSTFLIDGDGRIAGIWDNVRLKGHIDAVLEAATTLAP